MRHIHKDRDVGAYIYRDRGMYIEVYIETKT